MKKSSLFILFLVLLSCTKDEEPLASIPPTTDLPPSTVEPPPVNPPAAIGPMPCENGMAGIYPCNGYDFLSRISLNEFNSLSGNDNWGWTDPETGIEYVLNGLNDGTGFVSIEDPENPVYLGKLPTASDTS